MRKLPLFFALLLFSANTFAFYHCKNVTVPVPAGTHTAGDLVVDTFAVPALSRTPRAQVVLDKIILRDLDDQGVDLTVWFLGSNTSMGTVGAAWQPSDTIAKELVDFIDVSASDYKDLTNSKIAVSSAIGKIINLASDRNLYMGIVTGGAPTFTDNNITMDICVFDQ